ncbi:hypothetical protein FM110_02185 [Brachybacterium nesterenkovii]|uniref:Uncharacterized protein n=1 Tax=Brachybacterium nesterenkovii TaxID=47847 RepID=A0A1X6WU56_9MICO|nr:hypothetical protein FM110_02185 [Brachybacterium nesterenkovii]
MADGDRGRPVGDHQHPLCAAEVAHRARAEHGGDRLADPRLVREQELPSTGSGVGRDRVGRLVLVQPGLEVFGRRGDRCGIVGIELVLEELAEGVRAGSVGREVLGQGAPGEQVLFTAGCQDAPSTWFP